MRRFLSLFVLLSIFMHQMMLSSACAYAETTTGMAIVYNPIPTDRLSLRVKPDKSSESLGRYYSGTEVEVLETVDNDWVKVCIGYIDSGYLEGYVMRNFLVTSDSNQTVEPAFPMKRCMKESFFGLYTKPEEASTKVRHAESHDVIFDMTMPITVLGDLPNGWCHVSIKGNDRDHPRADENGNVVYTGFIKQDLLSPLNDHLGLVSKASIEYDPNANHPFTETELDGAVAVIKEQFEISYVGCELIRLWYNEAQSDEFLSNEPHMQISPEYIVFLSDFNCVTGYPSTGFETGALVSGWTWFLNRTDSDSEWQIIGWGMF